ncbi:carboxyl-terminal processing protease [Dysgonomonas sp. PH5-45]|uniref:S41 family peptidase n=1 Tax=unclassified Dysgonomonas TaxID=2630389 RepID=UPI002475AD85|nr:MULTISPECIES: S41 family peptidase [unclassified Dysgonomonas]MDH6354372.1 carboxyl-terminal processing protease [Dysgonomonas sp. PH5-45]MDH6387272.1 carboxyl-terminal processing protease [Dysgonomonas sp. PH5-37]
MDSPKKTTIWLPLWIGLSIAIGIFIGNAFSIFSSRKSLFNRGDKLEAVLEYISESYVDTVNIQELVENTIPALIAGLDPHSNYYTAKEMEITGEELTGHFSGIGVSFYVLNDTITIMSTMPGGPSEAAGLKPGDRIVYANDSLLAGVKITNEKVTEKLRGKKGTTVKLGIKRYNKPGIEYVSVERDDVPVNSIDAVFTPNSDIGYIKISKFASTTYNEFISAISQLKSQSAKSVIIDLRQNTGGYLVPSEDMINEFLEKGDLIVYTEGRAFARRSQYANGSGTCKDMQLVVLIDENSASASEVFAGAIQDNDRGLIVGRRSFGKGLVQTQYPFRDGSALRLTIARYYTPSGRCIQKPYQIGHREDYDMDYYNRYMSGEMYSADSIKFDESSVFYTAAGRLIHGNGGIMPDVFVPRDTVGMTNYYTKLFNSGAIYEYSMVYSDVNRKKLSSFTTWKDMYAYLLKQALLPNLLTFAETKSVKREQYLPTETQKLIQKQLSAYIVRNYFGDAGFYPILLSDDIVLKEAIKQIKANKATPKVIKESGKKKTGGQRGN